MATTTSFTIIKKQMFDWHTEYQIEYNGKTYKCIHNGGLPKLQGVTLSESKRCELDRILEHDFLYNYK